MLFIHAIIIMSTYCPKTLRGWKIHKRSQYDLLQFHEEQTKQNLNKSYVIHAFQYNKKNHDIPAQPIKKDRYKMDDSRTKSMRLSNGFRKVKKQDYSTSYSKVISDDKLVRINNLITDYKNKDQTRQNIDKSFPKSKQRHKKMRIMRGEIKKKPIQNSILNKLLLIKTPHHNNVQETLFTDNQNIQLSQLENEEFSPYRSKRQANEQTKENAMIQIASANKQEQPLCQHLNFLSISQINLKQKEKLCRPKFKLKKRSFSANQLNIPDKFARKGTRRLNFGVQIEPWKISQKYA